MMQTEFQLVPLVAEATRSVSIALVLGALATLCLGMGIAHVAARRWNWPVAVGLGLLAPACLLGTLVLVLFAQGRVLQTLGETPLPTLVDLPSAAHVIVLASPSAADAGQSRPDWVEQPAGMEGNTYFVSIASDPKLTVAEAMADLAAREVAAVRSYVSELLGTKAADAVLVDREFVEARLVRSTHQEIVTLSVGKMHVVHARLGFDADAREELRQRYAASIARQRLRQTGAGAGLAIVALAIFFAALKIDTATRGFYTARLHFAAAGLILAVVWTGYILLF